MLLFENELQQHEHHSLWMCLGDRARGAVAKAALLRIPGIVSYPLPPPLE